MEFCSKPLESWKEPKVPSPEIFNSRVTYNIVFFADQEHDVQYLAKAKRLQQGSAGRRV